MTVEQVLDVAREAIIALIWISTPIMLVGLIVGLIIAIFQSLTQIQEITLTFVPKLLAVFASLLVFAPYMLTKLQEFMLNMADRIIAIG